MYLVILLYALFAAVFTLSKGALNYSEPFFFIGSRMFVAGLILLLFYRVKQGQWPKLEPLVYQRLILLSLLAVYLTNIMEIWATQYVPSSKVCLLYSLSPFLSALLGFWVLHEQLNVRQWAGLCLGFVGLGPMTWSRQVPEMIQGHFLLSLPELAMLIAVIGSVYGWIVLKQLVNQHKLSPLFVNGWSMTLGGALALIHSYVSHEAWTPWPVQNWPHFLGFALMVCLISNLICYNLYGYLLQRFSATFLSFAGLITPLFASSFGWFFLNESIGWPYFVSVCLFSAGLTLFYSGELRQLTRSPNIA